MGGYELIGKLLKQEKDWMVMSKKKDKTYAYNPETGERKEINFDMNVAWEAHKARKPKSRKHIDTEKNSMSKDYVERMAEHEHNPRMVNSIGQEGFDETYHDWWLKKGKFFSKDQTKQVHKDKFEIFLGEDAYKMGQCYYNATMVAIADDSYRYYEGMAQGDAGVSLHHAWLVKNGKVVDPTWNGAGHDYFGVPIPTTYVRKRVLKTGLAESLLGHFWHEKVRPKQLKQKKSKRKVKGDLMF